MCDIFGGNNTGEDESIYAFFITLFINPYDVIWNLMERKRFTLIIRLVYPTNENVNMRMCHGDAIMQDDDAIS